VNRQISFIINPKAGSFSARLVARIRERFPEATLHFTETAGDGVRLARILSQREKVLVACGGDGTLREVLEGAEEGSILAFLPLGTLNLVPRHLGIPLSLDGALDLIEKGETKNIFPGVIATPQYTKPFLLAISAGPDADAIHSVRLRLKRLIGRFAYAVSFIQRIFKPVIAEIPISVDGEEFKAGSLTLLRGPFYGGTYRFGKAASLEKAGVEVLATGRGRLALLRLYISIMTGGLISEGRSIRRLGKVATFTSPTGRIQIDGDMETAFSATIYTQETPVKVICGEIK